MWTVTVDQEGSRRVGDRVELLLADLRRDSPLVGAAPGAVVLPFDRTVGDEVQAVLGDPDLVVAVALHLIRIGGWSVGIGAGTVDGPLPATSRAGSGTAFIHARAAVEAAKSRLRGVPLAVRGPRADLAAEAEGVLTLLGSVVARRTADGWSVVDRLSGAGAAGARQQDVAAELGISQQAVSARLRAALWSEELAARPAAARLLRLAGADDDDGGSEDEGADA
ncbi:SatD family protein [Cellulomonas sp. RIT-PI-Y]|uniref:SatD family protein n=1 Tax=Cellulomonas sp. RIT-PI-Y TaxID=3035297 RepID=UPI0021D922DF|nr:SatD family protein [Cellulomonas sp. RIT-PI-Y]